MKKMKLTFYTFLAIFLFTSLSVDAQRWKARRYELSLGLGTANVYGDIGGANFESIWAGPADLDLQFTRPVISVGVRYKITGNIAAKVNLNGAYITGNDLNSKNQLGRGTDDVSSPTSYEYRSMLGEFTGQLEYYFLSEVRKLRSNALYNKRGMINDFLNVQVYAFAGFGAVYTNPTVYDYYSQAVIPSDNFGYVAGVLPKVNFAFPAGVGAKFIWNSDWEFGASLGMRMTTTDNIDGYYNTVTLDRLSYNHHNDWYSFLTVEAIYRIPTDRRGLPIFFNKIKKIE